MGCGKWCYHTAQMALKRTPPASSSYRLLGAVGVWGCNLQTRGSWVSDRQREHFQEERKVPLPIWGRWGESSCTTLDALLWNHNQSERYISITPHNYAETDFLRGVNINFRGGHALN